MLSDEFGRWQRLGTSDIAWYLAAMADQRLSQCQLCGYTFDRVEGDADGDVKPAVVFDDIPADWSSPVAAAEKDDFLLQGDAEV
jgi:rubredoxin